MPVSKEEAVAAGRAKAREYMRLCGSCAQSTVMALQDILQLGDNAVARAATAMTGGIGGQGDACGCLLGAAMITGMIYGIDQHTIEDKRRMSAAIGKTTLLYNWFKQAHGSARCRDIVTGFGDGVYYDMGIPEQAEKARDLGIDKKCGDLVEKTVAHMIDILWENVQAMNS